MSMHKPVVFVLFLLTFVAMLEGQPLPGLPSGCRMHSIQIEGYSTYIYAINNHGDVSGAYVTDQPTLGFLLKSGQVTTIQWPGAMYTDANGVRGDDTVVGTYVQDSQSLTEGFTWKSGTFTQFNVPGALTTTPTGINGSGEIVGSYQDSKYTNHGFLFQNGTFTTIDHPKSTDTFLSQINKKGAIVGIYLTPAGHEHSFLYRGGRFTAINYPGAVNTQVAGVNSYNEAVGSFNRGPGTRYHSFYWKNGIYTKIDVPNQQTFLNGINDSRVIAGEYGTTSITGVILSGCTP